MENCETAEAAAHDAGGVHILGARRQGQEEQSRVLICFGLRFHSRGSFIAGERHLSAKDCQDKTNRRKT